VDEQNTTNRPLLVFLMVAQSLALNRALLVSFLKRLFDAFWLIQRCSLDCQSILRGLGSLLEIIMLTSGGTLLIQQRELTYLGQLMTRLVVQLSQLRETDYSWHPSVVGREN